MTEQQTQQVPETQTPEKNNKQLILCLIIVIGVVVWGVNNPSTALRILAVLLGFGGIIMIHELGHFLMAKLGGIKVEAFSIGMGPVLLGIRKLKKGWRFRVFPKIGEEQIVEEGDNDTEYQIALLPIGGFVKMLGQSDTGAADVSDDPRSYANRPVWIRICVVSAGVVFNAVGAIILFMILFMNGIDLKPAVVGQVVPNSPAYDAGLKEGDRIMEINGERFVDFESVLLAPALSEPGEPITFVVRDRDTHEEETIKIIAEKQAGDTSNLRYTGIAPAKTLTIEPMIRKDSQLVEQMYEQTGFYPDDKIKTLDGTAVMAPWNFTGRMSHTFRPEVEIGVSRIWPSAEDSETEPTITTVTLPMEVAPVVDNFRDEYDLAHFCSLVPRLQVRGVYEPSIVNGLPRRISKWFKRTILRRPVEELAKITPDLYEGDVILKIGSVDHPNFRQLRETVAEHKNKDLPVTVMRKDEEGNEQIVETSVYPQADPATGRIRMGISAILNMNKPVVAQVLDISEQAVLPTIPVGATIMAVDGEPVESFFDVARILYNNPGRRISIDYVVDGQAGGTAVQVLELKPVHAKASVATGIPFEELTYEFKATGPFTAVQMGIKKTWQFISRSIVTLGRLFQRSVPMKALSGPVGIITMTYQVTGGTLDQYLYFLGLISSCLAVMNLLPLPVLDGGHIVILLIERFTGKPINERLLAGAMYAGVAFLLGLMLWISYNDIMRIAFGR